MLLPSIQTLIITDLGHYHLMLAVILILKHATFLRLSGLICESALSHADIHYQVANIDLKVQQHLAASSQEHTVLLFAGFIMATDILADIESMHLNISVPSQSSPSSSKDVHRKKDHWFKRVFPRKPTISLPKLRDNE